LRHHHWAYLVFNNTKAVKKAITICGWADPLLF